MERDYNVYNAIQLSWIKFYQTNNQIRIKERRVKNTKQRHKTITRREKIFVSHQTQKVSEREIETARLCLFYKGLSRLERNKVPVHLNSTQIYDDRLFVVSKQMWINSHICARVSTDDGSLQCNNNEWMIISSEKLLRTF